PLRDQAAQLSAFLAGNIDSMNASYDLLKELPKNTNVLKAPEFFFNGLRFQVNRPPYNDPRVRRAINLAIDRDAMNQILYNGDAGIGATVTPAYGQWALP